MNILLLGSPIVSQFFARSQIPNLGLLSIASNLDKRHQVKIIDSYMDSVNIREVIADFCPKVVGLSCMSFQYEAAKVMAKMIKKINPSIVTVLGGYHATLMYKEILDSEDSAVFDFIIRHEGEIAFNRLIDELEGDRRFDTVPNLSYKEDGKAIHNEYQGDLDISQINLPDRSLVKDNVYLLYNNITEAIDKAVTIETSRGCKHNCSYCSIKKMYTMPYREYPLQRVIEDIKNISRHMKDVTRIFIIDDNITCNPERFEKLCDMIIENGLNTYRYFCQCSCIGIASSEALVRKMKQAGFDMVFLGMENNDPHNLKYLGKGNIVDSSVIACKYLRKYRVKILGGMMIGCPDDTKESIRNIYRFLKRLKVDVPGVQCVTPYPKTQLRENYLAMGLIDNTDQFAFYDGYFPNVHTKHMSAFNLYRTNTLEQARYYLYLYLTGKKRMNRWGFFKYYTYLLMAKKKRNLIIYHMLETAKQERIKRSSEEYLSALFE